MGKNDLQDAQLHLLWLHQFGDVDLPAPDSAADPSCPELRAIARDYKAGGPNEPLVLPTNARKLYRTLFDILHPGERVAVKDGRSPARRLSDDTAIVRRWLTGVAVEERTGVARLLGVELGGVSSSNTAAAPRPAAPAPPPAPVSNSRPPSSTASTSNSISGPFTVSPAMVFSPSAVPGGSKSMAAPARPSRPRKPPVIEASSDEEDEHEEEEESELSSSHSKEGSSRAPTSSSSSNVASMSSKAAGKRKAVDPTPEQEEEHEDSEAPIAKKSRTRDSRAPSLERPVKQDHSPMRAQVVIPTPASAKKPSRATSSKTERLLIDDVGYLLQRPLLLRLTILFATKLTTPNLSSKLSAADPELVIANWKTTIPFCLKSEYQSGITTPYSNDEDSCDSSDLIAIGQNPILVRLARKFVDPVLSSLRDTERDELTRVNKEGLEKLVTMWSVVLM